MPNPSAAPLFPPGDTLARWQRAAQPVSLDALVGTAQSLGIVVPHADDETLGCGGLIAAAAARGLAITITVLTDGAGSHPASRAWPAARLRSQRRTEVTAAAAILTGGTARLVFGNAPDGDLAAHGATAVAIPPADLLIGCWQDDPHPDHQAAFGIALAAAEAMRARLLAFPLWCLTTDTPPPTGYPLARLDTAAQLPRKRQALGAHRSQLGTLIADDPDGFVLDAALQALFVRADELYLVIR